MCLTQDKEWRIRGGISKVPFGFEVLQSSQQRLALDRTDAINSAVPNERDTGFFLYYTPVETRKLFRRLVDSGLKGSGDYGILGVGVYNGETLNVGEANDNKHVVLHSTYPFELPMDKSCKSELTPTVEQSMSIPGLSRRCRRTRRTSLVGKRRKYPRREIWRAFRAVSATVRAPGRMELGPRSGTERSQDSRSGRVPSRWIRSSYV